MKETTIEEAVHVAHAAHSADKKWHFHMLSPSCKFNIHKDRHALVVEVPTDELVYVVYSQERPMQIGQQLVALLHGKKVLQGSGDALQASNSATAEILKRAKELNSRGVPWHHHLLFPECKLNSSPGQWNLIFEDPETGQVLNSLYRDEPISDLKEVEALFYAQKN